MIKNIVFDIGNVLVDFGWKGFFDKFNLTDEQFERVAKATVYSPVWNDMDMGVYSEETLLEKFIENDPGIEDILRKIYVDFKGLLIQFDYAKPWIKELGDNGFKVYCLSNMSHKSVRENADALDFIAMLDGSVLSCHCKLCKPDKAIYELLFKRYELKPEECIFIDDLEKNVNAAIACGMKGILFKNREDAIKEIDRIVAEEN